MTSTGEIDPSAIRDELDRILSSETFSQSQMAMAFLRYVVTESLEGRADRIKGYTIAVEALEKPDSFDPGSSPLVRVQAKRLRDLLDRYYADEGRTNAVRITLPVGGYSPVFLPFDGADDGAGATGTETPVAGAGVLETDGDAIDEPDAPAEPEIAAGVPSQRRSAYWLGAGLAAALVLVAVAGRFVGIPGLEADPHQARLDLIAEAGSRPAGRSASEVLPVLHIHARSAPGLPAWFDPRQYLDRTQSFAARFADTVIVHASSEESVPDTDQPHYHLNFDFIPRGDGVYTTALVTREPDERLVTSYSFNISEGNAGYYVPDLQTTTPDDLKTIRNLVQAHGLIYADVGTLAQINAPLACLQAGHRYYIDSTSDNHLNARDCLEETIRDHPRLAQAFNMLGAMYMTEYRRGMNPLPGDALERAEAALRKAVELAPLSSATHQNLQSLFLITGNEEAAIAEGRRAIELNPDDADAIGNFGSLLARLGRYEGAIPMLQRAVSELTPGPQWAYYYMFLSLNNLGRTAEADQLSGYFLGTRSSLYLTAVILAAHRRGAEADKQDAIKALLEVETEFRKDPFQPYRRRGLAEPVIERLLKDLETAGVPVTEPEQNN